MRLRLGKLEHRSPIDPSRCIWSVNWIISLEGKNKRKRKIRKEGRIDITDHHIVASANTGIDRWCKLEHRAQYSLL